MQQTRERSQSVRLYSAAPLGARVAELVDAADSKSVSSTLNATRCFCKKFSSLNDFRSD